MAKAETSKAAVAPSDHESRALRQRKREIDVRVGELKAERIASKAEIDSITEKLRGQELVPAADRKHLSVVKERAKGRSKEINTEIATLTAEKKAIVGKLAGGASA